jgi:hypothetical protein
MEHVSASEQAAVKNLRFNNDGFEKSIKTVILMNEVKKNRLRRIAPIQPDSFPTSRDTSLRMTHILAFYDSINNRKNNLLSQTYLLYAQVNKKKDLRSAIRNICSFH